MASAKKILRRLKAAREQQMLIELSRAPKFADRKQGFVVAIGSEWVLLAQTVDAGFFDGHVAVRLGDIKSVRRDTSFQARMSRRLPEWPPSPPNSSVDLDSTAGVLRTLGAENVLIGAEKERERTGMWIGVVFEISKRWLWLSEVRPDASWLPAPLGYKLKAITAVTVGGRYLVGLRTIADLEHSAD